jgi:hypothetical protein
VIFIPHLRVSIMMGDRSVPGLLPPAPLYEKTRTGELRLFQGKRGQGKGWRDGSLKKDLPFGTFNHPCLAQCISNSAQCVVNK